MGYFAALNTLEFVPPPGVSTNKVIYGNNLACNGFHVYIRPEKNKPVWGIWESCISKPLASDIDMLIKLTSHNQVQLIG